MRNPDGAEGVRTTGNVAETADNKGVTTGYFGQSTEGKNVIKIYFAKAGDLYTPEDPTQPGLPPAAVAVGAKDFEVAAVWSALREFEKVADVVYVETQNRNDADFHYVTYTGTPGPGVSLLGSMAPPGETDEGLALFNSSDNRWNATNLAQGGFSFVTLIHEFGHGHGMSHPHDNGGRSSVMRGVVAEGAGVADYTTGEFDLNQGVFTMMSYEDGWAKSPYGNAATNAGYGYLGGLMAFDIAVIQDKYGVNEEWATGDDTYTMKDVNAAGTFYYSICDAGGTDQIVYDGAKDATIDLRAATLKYETGGGNVSYATGIFGGFTIANGVTIENARGGSGNDTLIGNTTHNVLNGGAGADNFAGGAGNDFYIVDDARDLIVEAADEGADTVVTSVDYRLAAEARVELFATTQETGTAALTLFGNGFSQTIFGNAGANILVGGGGADTLIGLAGNDFYIVDGDDRVVEARNGGVDTVVTSQNHRLTDGAEIELFATTDERGTAGLTLVGNEASQFIYGNAGANTLIGNGGTDTLVGLAGNDFYVVDGRDDRVIDGVGRGFDTVSTFSDYELSSETEVELFATVAERGTDPLALTGNRFAQTIYGNAGANTIDGKGGSDTLVGLDGADRFLFTTALGSDDIDRIVGFEGGQDRIGLGASVFTGLTPGALAAGAFRMGDRALDADDRIMYNSSTRALLYDADGNGAGAAVQFASLAGGLTLTAADFFVI